MQNGTLSNVPERPVPEPSGEKVATTPVVREPDDGSSGVDYKPARENPIPPRSSTSTEKTPERIPSLPAVIKM